MTTFDKSPISRFAYPVVFGALGFGGFVFINYMMRRPLYSGIQRHIIGGIVGVAFGEGIHNFSNYLESRRDTILHHYMELHPEDFQPEEKKLYKDVLQPWYPIR